MDDTNHKWEVENPKKCIRNCDHAASMVKHKIVLTAKLWDVVRAMTLKYPMDEWQMMLSGTVKDGVCHCTGYYITHQEVTGGTVSNKDCVDAAMIKKLKLVAGIHSHVNMAVQPSGTDIDDSVMSLIDYHLIVNNRYELNGMRKGTLPCKELAVLPCECYVEGLVDLSKVEIEGLERITKKVYPGAYQGAGYAPTWRKMDDTVYGRDYDDEHFTKQMLANGGY